MRSLMLLQPVALAVIGLAVAAPTLPSTLSRAVLEAGEEIADPPVLNAREITFNPPTLKARKEIEDPIVIDVGKVIGDPPVLNA